MPYHLLARAHAPQWWRPVLGTLVLVVTGAALGLATYLAAGAVAGRPDGPDGLPSLGELGDMVLAFVTVAVFLPAAMLAARWVQRRPAGTLSSVAGRLRWRWLLTCLPVALGSITLVLLAGSALTPASAGLVGWRPFATSMALLVLVVPVQAAAEEYVCRGWLLQAVGTWVRGPWLPIAVQAVVFAALHGWGTPWGFADLLAFGVVAGWLTVRTGGLEAAIALHVANNLLSAGLAAALGELTVDETAADLPWEMVAVDVPQLVAYAAVVLWLARRRGLAPARTAPGAPAPTASGAPVPVAAGGLG